MIPTQNTISVVAELRRPFSSSLEIRVLSAQQSLPNLLVVLSQMLPS